MNLQAVSTAIIIAILLIFFLYKTKRKKLAQAQLLNIPNEISTSKKNKIVIFYSSIGHGHISAAKAIEKEILELSPQSLILLQDIREFMDPLWRKLDEKIYWFIVNNLKESFEILFWNMQKTGVQTPSLSNLKMEYPEDLVLRFIEKVKAQTIISTHYGAAQTLGSLREKGYLSEVKIGWMHTDFFEGYFPRISMRLDRTFLGHSELAEQWKKAGVPSDLIEISGVPTQRLISSKKQIKLSTFKDLNLDIDLPTILILGGKEGAVDYKKIIESIAFAWNTSIQIIAICGTNTQKQSELQKTYQDSTHSHIKILPLGFISQQIIFNLMYSTDLLITKAGGLTPTEAFARELPTILVDAIGGHEHENALLFSKLGLALLCKNETDAGTQSKPLLANSALLEQMRLSQKKYRENSNFKSIADFVVNFKKDKQSLEKFGSENGLPATGIREVMEQLKISSPASIEILLSYPTSKTPTFIAYENPFGHLALRLEDIVCSTNYLADAKKPAPFMQLVSIENYLFSVTPPPGNQQHTNTYGMAYGRDTIGLRVNGISTEALNKMKARVSQIENEFAAGDLNWTLKEYNCTHAVIDILESGGFQIKSRIGVGGSYSIPLDVFDVIFKIFEQWYDFKLDLVIYKKMVGSQAEYRYTHFPLTFTRPIGSILQVFTKTADKFEASAQYRVSNFYNERIFIEHISDLSIEKDTHKLEILKALADDISHQINATLSNIQENNKFTIYLDRSLEKSKELARMITEQNEDSKEVLSENIRKSFIQLSHQYGKIKINSYNKKDTLKYLGYLNKFNSKLKFSIKKSLNTVKQSKK